MARRSRWLRLCWIAWIATLVIMVISPAGAQSPAADGPQQWHSLNAQAWSAYQAGDYPKGLEFAERALSLARQSFGDRDPKTLTSLTSVAFLYDHLGRYGEAEPLYQEALQARRQVLGPRHPDTVISLNNLAALYTAQGRYGEAEPLFRARLAGFFGLGNSVPRNVVDRARAGTGAEHADATIVLRPSHLPVVGNVTQEIAALRAPGRTCKSTWVARANQGCLTRGNVTEIDNRFVFMRRQ
jgi:tetratricopeptide (TPR) repeat protein